VPGLPCAEVTEGRKAPERPSAKATEREEPEFYNVSEKAGEQAHQRAGAEAGEPNNAIDYNYRHMNVHPRRKANTEQATEEQASKKSSNQTTKCERITELKSACQRMHR